MTLSFAFRSTLTPAVKPAAVIDERYFLSLYSQGARALLRYLQQIESHISDAEARVTRCQQSLVARLSKELAKVKAALAKKSAQLVEQQQLNHRLLGRIRELERAMERGAPHAERDSHNSSLPPSADPPWKKVKRTRSLRKKTGRSVGGQVGHPGATLRQTAHPDHLIIHTPEACQQCGTSLDHSQPQGIIRRQVFDIEDGRVKVTEHRSAALLCPECGAINRAAFPASVRAPVQYGGGVLSRTAYLHLYQLLPVGRTSETMRDLFGCSLSPATVQRAARVSSAKLVHSELRIKAALRDAPVMGVDETGLRVAGHVGYIHVARTHELTHYAFDERRGKPAMDEIGILPEFKGTLVRDGFTSYAWYSQCRHSLCNVHLLRDLVFIEETSPEQKVWTTPMAKLLLKIKDTVAEARAGPEARLGEEVGRKFVKSYERLVKRGAKLNPQPDSTRRGPPPGRPPFLPTPRTIIGRLQRKRDEVLCFMRDISVPFDNNGSERDLRMVKLQQKISGCFRTSDGARNFCRVRSYLSTARKQGHSLLYSLERVLAGKPLPFQIAELASAT